MRDKEEYEELEEIEKDIIMEMAIRHVGDDMSRIKSKYIARMLDTSSKVVAGNLNKLEEKGFVVRTGDGGNADNWALSSEV